MQAVFKGERRLATAAWAAVLISFLIASCRAGQVAQPASPSLEATAEPPTPTATSTPTVQATPTVLQGTGSEYAEAGKQVYLETCAVCHGLNAEGNANDSGAPALDGSQHAPEHPDPQIHEWIVNGKLGLGQSMPALGDRLDDGQVHAVIAYLHTLWDPEQLTIQQDLSRRWPATAEPTWTPVP